jgi:carbamoyltransferase
MNILGISAFYHDSAACLVCDGDIVSAAQEERFTRKKHDFRWPGHAIDCCLREAGVQTSDLDLVAFYDKPLTKFDRILESYFAYAPKGIRSFFTSMPIWMKQKLFLKDFIRKSLQYDGKILFPEHHESHAASAFFPSPIEEAAILTADGVGEWATTTIGIGRGNRIELFEQIDFPHSLGLLYSAFTYYTGFKVNSGEYKLMGLSPYGEPKYVDLILNEIVKFDGNGAFCLNMKYFDYCAGLTMTNGNFHKLFGGPPRKPESQVSQKEMDLAASIQHVTEEIMLAMARYVHRQTGMKNLCLAGGVALNCVANGRILREGPFQRIWIQPAAGDAGGALGAAFIGWYQYLKKARTVEHGKDSQKDSLLGPAFSDREIKDFLDKRAIPYRTLDRVELIKKVADLLTQEKVIGWFQGRMEFGPRALGSRSILGDARSPAMQTTLNLKIKFRESFRPFAPAVLRESVSEWFELDRESPYMLLVASVKKEKCRSMSEAEKKMTGLQKLRLRRSEIPAVTHVDYSARIQTVDRKHNALFYDLINEFYQKTGCPVIINTSFNVRGEPIVCTPEDAYLCFMRTEMDYLAMGAFLLDKAEQPPLQEDRDWKKEMPLD